MPFDFNAITPHQEKLAGHPVYQALKTRNDLRIFMAHHVYSVWDFMSLVKCLQGAIAPTTFPWAPKADPEVVRFINEMVMEEESDRNVPGVKEPAFLSHFELYCRAMEEIGADAAPVHEFVKTASENGIDAALEAGLAPSPSATFTKQTFAFIATNKPHVVAAAFALGREQIIPTMFRSFLADMKITKEGAPMFHYYLERHIHLDEDFHGPMSMRMVENLCAGDPEKIQEAEDTAIEAIKARLTFWDGVYAAMPEKA